MIAERVAYSAQKVNAAAIAHGATGKGNDQIRFERAWAYLVPNIELIAPWKIWDYKGRKDLIQYIESQGFSYKGEVNPKYSLDANLLHNSSEGGILEDISQPYNPEEIFQFIAPPAKMATDFTDVTLAFENGLPVAMNGARIASSLLEQLNTIGGRHGIGLVDLVEERVTGVKAGAFTKHQADYCTKRSKSKTNLLGSRRARHLHSAFHHVCEHGLRWTLALRRPSISRLFHASCDQAKGSHTPSAKRSGLYSVAQSPYSYTANKS